MQPQVVALANDPARAHRQVNPRRHAAVCRVPAREKGVQVGSCDRAGAASEATDLVVRFLRATRASQPWVSSYLNRQHSPGPAQTDADPQNLARRSG